MNSKILLLACAASLTAAAAAGVFWHHDHESLGVVRAQILAGELQPIARLLAEDQDLLRELRSEALPEKDPGILESYLARIRRDGVARQADMKQRLDMLAENNAAIVALIKAYAPHAKTPGFTIEADRFRNYASAWRDRWNSVLELFMAGGNFAASQIPFPAGFPEAVQAEVSANRPALDLPERRVASSSPVISGDDVRVIDRRTSP